ncbi:MAG: hypothetical protein ACLP0J_26415 [Solirubrobacteraceae bacterium]
MTSAALARDLARDLGSLPERASVHWRPRLDDAALRGRGRSWTLTTIAHTVPFIVAAGALAAVKPVLAPVALALLIHAWAIPELYAARGAGVLRRRAPADAGPEARALLLLGDLVDEPNRQLHARTGLVLAPGELGIWVLGEAGALLVRPGAHRVNCYCVKATGTNLPHGDRIAHLLLALRCDERDFATVANLAFSGASWRLRRRLAPQQREALWVAREACRSGPRQGPRPLRGLGLGPAGP